MGRREFRSAALALSTMAVLFGGTWPAGKVAAEHVAPATAASVRFVACALLWLWAHLAARPIRRPVRADVPLVLATGAGAAMLLPLSFLGGGWGGSPPRRRRRGPGSATSPSSAPSPRSSSSTRASA